MCINITLLTHVEIDWFLYSRGVNILKSLVKYQTDGSIVRRNIMYPFNELEDSFILNKVVTCKIHNILVPCVMFDTKHKA